MVFEGTAVVLGDNIDTDQILPGYAMAEPPEKLGSFAMAGLADEALRNYPIENSIFVAGKNFGCGSSREQAPLALKQRNVQLILAEGFARIFRRNCINIGLPVCAAPVLESVEIKTGDPIRVDIENGLFCLHGVEYSFPPISANSLETLKHGGLLPRVRAELGLGSSQKE